jgi:hypothetical protein
MRLARRDEETRAAESERPLLPMAVSGAREKLGGVPPDESDEYKVVLDVVRGLADQEYDRGERLSVKARQAFGFVAVLLAAVQAAALNSLGKAGVTEAEQSTILVMALIAVGLATATGILALVTDGPRWFHNLASEDVLDSASDSLQAGQPVAMDLSQLYATVLDDRREAVDRRRYWLNYTQISSVLTIFALATELLYTLHTRLP